MHPVLIRFLGLSGIGVGCYLVLGLAVPRLRARSWSKDPTGVVASFAAFSILLGLRGLGAARPYTWIAALGALGIGYVILASKPAELVGLLRPVLERRAVIAFFVVSIVVVLVCFLLV
jgi:hypothetical protein